MNTWPNGMRCAVDQARHREWNATHYPGTRQLCSVCDEPTGRCEDDSITNSDCDAICETCSANQEQAP